MRRLICAFVVRVWHKQQQVFRVVAQIMTNIFQSNQFYSQHKMISVIFFFKFICQLNLSSAYRYFVDFGHFMLKFLESKQTTSCYSTVLQNKKKNFKVVRCYNILKLTNNVSLTYFVPSTANLARRVAANVFMFILTLVIPVNCLKIS